MILVWVVVCVLVADFFSGLFHWWEDTYGNPEWDNFVGRNVVIPNLLHHKNPRKFLEASVYHRNFITMMLAVGITGFVCLLFGFHWQFVLVALIGGLSNEFHAMSHRRKDELPPIVRLLHKWNILASPKHHSIHHHSPYDTYYCVITPFLNPILDRVRFWVSIELILSKIGIFPMRGNSRRMGY